MKLFTGLLLLQGASASLFSPLWSGNAQRPLEQQEDKAASSADGDYAITTIYPSSFSKPPQINSSFLSSLHEGLVSRPSVTGNESGVGEYLAHTLHLLDFTVEKQYLTPDRFNIYAYFGRKRPAVRTILSSHIDTVPPFLPYERHANGTISGRGSVDAKASVAAQICALMALVNSDLVAWEDVGLLFVVGEETNGDGMRAANALNLKPETVIFGEPTEKKLACGHKGILVFQVLAEGKAAHSGYPWLGVSANELLVAALVRMQGVKLPETEKYGNTTLNLGRIDGGVAGNVVPEKAYAEVTIRLAGGEPQEVKNDIEKAVLGGFPSGSDGKLEVKWLGNEYAPVDIDCKVDGFDTITVNYGTDIPNFDLAPSQKRYLYGPGSILVAHSDHEAILVDDLYDAVNGYIKLIKASL